MDISNILKTIVKTCHFIRDDEVMDKYNEIWDVIKNKFLNYMFLMSIKFHSEPIYDKNT